MLLVVWPGAPSSVLAPNRDGLIACLLSGHACDHCDHEVDGEKAAQNRETSETGFGGGAPSKNPTGEHTYLLGG